MQAAKTFRQQLMLRLGGLGSVLQECHLTAENEMKTSENKSHWENSGMMLDMLGFWNTDKREYLISPSCFTSSIIS